MKANTGVILVAAVLFLLAITGIQQGWFGNKPGTLSTVSGTCPTGTTGTYPTCTAIVNAPGTAYCPNTGTVLANSAGPAQGCYVQSQILQILITDFSTGKTVSGTWDCAYRNPSTGGIVENPSSFSNGKCISGNAYSTGTTMAAELCSASTCPPSTPYSATTTIVEVPLPSPSQLSYGAPNIGAGTVAFSTLAAASTAPTLYLVQPVVQIATYTLGVPQVVGGGSQTTAVTCSGPGTGVTSFSKATYGAKINIYYNFFVTNSIATPPGGFGFSSFPQYEQGGRTLGAWLRIEVNANGTGTDMPLISGAGFTSPYRPTLTDAFYIARAADASITKQVDNNNNPVNGLNGAYQFVVTADLTALGGSDAAVRINMIPYVYFSGDLYSGNLGSPAGSLNSEANTIGNLCSIKVAA